jgi:dihydroneopterin aldolase
MPTICLEGMKFISPIGYYDEEQLLLNEMEVSLELELIMSPDIAEPADEINRTVNYEEVYTIIKTIMAAPVKLLETAVKKIMTKITDLYPSVKRIKVRVSKINPPLSGRVDKVWVEDEWIREM